MIQGPAKGYLIIRNFGCCDQRNIGEKSSFWPCRRRAAPGARGLGFRDGDWGLVTAHRPVGAASGRVVSQILGPVPRMKAARRRFYYHQAMPSCPSESTGLGCGRDINWPRRSLLSFGQRRA